MEVQVAEARRPGEGVPAVVDLEDAVPVASVADDVAAGIAGGPARLLGGDSSQQARVEVVAGAAAVEVVAAAADAGLPWIRGG